MGPTLRGFAHKEISGSITIWWPPVREPRAVCAVHTGRRILHLHAYNILADLDEFGLSFQQNRPVQNKVHVECLGDMCDRNMFGGPGAGFKQIR